MLFNSLHFLLFFPIVTLLYFILPHRWQWVFLLFASYYFYMSWNPRYAVLMFLSTLITFISGLWIDRAAKEPNPKRQKHLKQLSVALCFMSNLLILFFFKYFGFFLGNLNFLLERLGFTILTPSFSVLLPVGISFYTFQALGYVMDVYRGDVPAEKNLARYALFVSFFPQLVAGPIERSSNLLAQIYETHHFSFDRMRSGLLQMLWGLFQKMVIADKVAVLVDTVYDNYLEYPGQYLVFATVLFAFQIYCDFSGYSDVAIGAAQVMGFSLMDNFKQPYFATSVQDFWRRWHISLSTWFRDYLYIPLGGSRGSRVKKYRNTMIVFLVSGLWHGANWTYVLWGGLHGALQIAEDCTRVIHAKLLPEGHSPAACFVRHAWRTFITFCLVDFAWIFFRAPSIAAASGILSGMFSIFNPSIYTNGSLYELGLSKLDLWISLLAILILLIADFLKSRFSVRDRLVRQNVVIRWGAYLLAIFAILLFGSYGPQYAVNQFIYFQF